MAELDHFAHGWGTPILALGMTLLGYLAGLVISVMGGNRLGRVWTRVLLYACIGGALAAIWVTNLVALREHGPPPAASPPPLDPMGHPGMPSATPVAVADPPELAHADPFPIAASLTTTLLLLGAGLVLAGYGRPVLWRLLLAGCCVGTSLATTHFMLVAATQAAGTDNHEPTRIIVPGTVAVATAAATAWFSGGGRGWRSTLAAAMLVGTVSSAAHFAAMEAIRRYLGPALDGGLTGVEPLLLLGPLVLVGTGVAATLAFFSLASPARLAGPNEIEPRIIEEVRARASVAMVPASRPPVNGGPRAGLPQRPVGPRPTPGIAPVWKIMPVWGASEVAESGHSVTGNRGATPTPLPRVGADDAPPGPAATTAPDPQDEAATTVLLPSRYPPPVANARLPAVGPDRHNARHD